MVVLALRVILVLLVVKANVASPSTKSRFDHEAKSGKTQAQESPLSLWITKYMKNIKTVVMERIENIKNWKNMEFSEEFASLKGGLSSDLDDVITDVQSKLKGTAYYYTPNHAHCCTLARFIPVDFETNKASF